MRKEFRMQRFKRVCLPLVSIMMSSAFAMEVEVTSGYRSSQFPYGQMDSQMDFMTPDDQIMKDNFIRYQNSRAPKFGLISEEAVRGHGTLVILSPVDHFFKECVGDNSKITEQEKERVKREGFVAEDGLMVWLIPNEEENQPRIPSDYFAKLRKKLPGERYGIGTPTDRIVEPSMEDYLAWALAGYDYQFGKSIWTPVPYLPSIILPEAVKAEVEVLAHVTTVFRDSIRTRTNQYTPNVGASLMVDLAKKYGASIEVITGDRLKNEFVGVYEVGKGSKDRPNVTILSWSHPNPVLTLDLVGKGVCFDTGGNNIKSDPNLMFMDKGGALAQNALAELIMAMNLPIKLRLGNAWVVNSPGGEATNTNDIYNIGGITVENKNTDAEGRLIMASVLTHFKQNNPAEITQTHATLTGAALVGYGSGTAVVYASKSLGGSLMKAMDRVADPVWRGPRDSRYLKDLKNSDADLTNQGPSYGGSSFADQFLLQFAAPTTQFVHIDAACAIKGSTGITPSVTSGDMFGVRGTYEFLKTVVKKRL